MCAPKGAGFLFARPDVQHLLKPLVVSWGYESEFPSGSDFVDHNEWWGTRDMAAFLSVPAAIRFQEEHNWDEVRDSCHQLLAYAQNRICELTGTSALHPQTDAWFRQMASVPLPAESDVLLIKNRLYDEYRIEVPVHEWFPSPMMGEEGGVREKYKLIRISIHGYNTKDDVDKLCEALSVILEG